MWNPPDGVCRRFIGSHPNSHTCAPSRLSRTLQLDVAAPLTTKEIYFFNAATNPLGDEDLGLKETSWRKKWRDRFGKRAA